MRVLLQQTVFEAALERIRFLFKEFPNVVAGISGGKDSTVVFQLCLRVARELGRLPLPVFFLDQEAEWTSTIEQVREIMYLPDVKPLWFQMPMHLDNAASFTTKYLKCWDEDCEADWIHPKDPISLKENKYGTDRFKDLFPAIFREEFPKQKVAVVSGVRCQETPSRFVGLTNDVTYKWVTWGRKLSPNQYTFYPLYDWSYRDVWHAIHSEGWKYNRIYDFQFRYGMPLYDMRVSNLHHETAVRHLFYLQEVDPGLYERLTKRLPGIDTAGKFGLEFYAKRLPNMFKDWLEYRDYLIERLVDKDSEWKANLIEQCQKWDTMFKAEPKYREKAAQAVVQSVLCNDYTGTKLENFRVGFVTKHKRDRARKLRFENDRAPRRRDPVVFNFFKHALIQEGVEENGRRVYHAPWSAYTYWIEGETICRAQRA